MRTDFMASKKQIAWRKKFAKMAKSGKFKKSRDTSTTATPRASKRIIGKEFKKLKRQSSLSKTAEYHRKKLRELGYSERTINQFLREHGKI